MFIFYICLFEKCISLPQITKYKKHMKKVFALFIAAGMITFMACGGGKDKAKEQARLDSLKKDSLMNDSIAKAEIAAKEADSLKQIAVKDSLMKDSVDKAKKDGKKEEKKK